MSEDDAFELTKAIGTLVAALIINADDKKDMEKAFLRLQDLIQEKVQGKVL